MISYKLTLPSFRLTCYWSLLRTYHSFKNWMYLCFIPYLGWHFTSLNMLPIPLDCLFWLSLRYSLTFIYIQQQKLSMFFFLFSTIVIVRCYSNVLWRPKTVQEMGVVPCFLVYWLIELQFLRNLSLFLPTENKP